MSYTLVYDHMYATSLTPEQHERTCGYWFTVTNGSMAHTAFATRAGLDRWLSERGLSLESDLADAGTWSTTRVAGTYRTESHGDFSPSEEHPYRMVADDAWSALAPVVITAAMSNGNYTLALITEDSASVRTVHTLNPNVKTRFTFDRRATDQLMR